ncbi:DsbA family protein [Gordonia sp. NPDC003422]
MNDKRKSGASVPKTTKSKYQPSANSSRMTYILGGLAILVVAALVIGGIFWSQRDKGSADDSALSANATMIAGPGTAPTIDLFEDPLCPICGQFEKQYGQQINAAITGNKIRVRFHTLDFLNQKSASGDYSVRAAGALTCVAAEGNTDVYLKFHSALFSNQPQEGGSSDLTNADLARIAGEQGASPATTKCIADGAKVGEAGDKATASFEELQKVLGDQAGTPTVLHNGEAVDISNTNWLNDIIGSDNA